MRCCKNAYSIQPQDCPVADEFASGLAPAMHAARICPLTVLCPSVTGVPKHHVCNANLMRNGADFSVYMSTAQEFDGCDSGARPDEAVSWGKIRLEANPVKVYGDATILMPLLISQTFAKNFVPKEETA